MSAMITCCVGCWQQIILFILFGGLEKMLDGCELSGMRNSNLKFEILCKQEAGKLLTTEMLSEHRMLCCVNDIRSRIISQTKPWWRLNSSCRIYLHFPKQSMAMNSFRLAGDICHLVSIIFLLYIVVWKGNAGGKNE
jgi:hypothetical protein